MYYHIRHGQRSDHMAKCPADWDQIKNTSDPHLTEEGKRMGLESGKYFKSLMNTPEFTNKKICIMTSPYYRCLQTTEKIIEGLGIENVYNKTIYVEYAYEEWWSNIANVGESARIKRVFNNLTPEYEKELFSQVTAYETNHFFADKDFWSSMTYPETYSSMIERNIKAIDHVAWLALQPEHQDKVFLVVSHGSYGFALEPMLNQTITMPNYCGIACLKVKANERVASLDSKSACQKYIDTWSFRGDHYEWQLNVKCDWEAVFTNYYAYNDSKSAQV